MKIMKVVYTTDCSESAWSSALEAYEDRYYMGEESWSVGEKFNGEFIQGEVTSIYLFESRGVEIDVNKKCALFIPLHAVQRIYYGEG